MRTSFVKKSIFETVSNRLHETQNEIKYENNRIEGTCRENLACNVTGDRKEVNEYWDKFV